MKPRAKLPFHWKVLIWMVAGVLAGLAMQFRLEAPPDDGATWGAHKGPGIELVAVSGPARKLSTGTVYLAAIVERGSDAEQRFPLTETDDAERVLAAAENGEVVWYERTDGELDPIALQMRPDAPRAAWIAPFEFGAAIFMKLLKMLIAPLVMASIMCGVAGVGTFKDLRRLGGKTFGYYVGTSLLAIVLGQTLVNLIRPGEGAQLGLSPLGVADVAPDASFIDVFKRMVPENVFAAMGDNSAMLQMIFFALLFGFFITQVAEPHSTRMRELVESFFQVMMKLADGVLGLLPYGVFCLMVKVVATTGFAVFEPLLLYMATVTLALLAHAMLTLPLVLRFVGRLSPLAWFRAMSPALLTAFSTSSSQMTLPVTMETVEQRGGVSNKVTSFTLPLGATINMDGTALYECIGVIFLAQYYGSSSGFELTFAMQGLIVLMALLASIGAAGIPSAGLVMMLTILAALGLPLEGAALLLAVDRPLDMLRTVVNVWSDSCGAAVIARSEGETGLPRGAGAP